MNSPKLRRCRGCGEPIAATARPSATFCNSACKATFHNRKKTRGAIAYDLVMAITVTTREERKINRALKPWSELNRLAENWRAEDAKLGIVSYDPLVATLTRLRDAGHLERC